MLVPKRWDRDTTLAALRAARETIAGSVGPVTFEADELEPPMRALAEARGWKAGDLFMAIRVAVDRPDRHAAAVRLARRARARAHARPARRARSRPWKEWRYPPDVERDVTRISHETVQAWLDAYEHAWQTYDADEVAALFSEDAEYRWHPCGRPGEGPRRDRRGLAEPERQREPTATRRARTRASTSRTRSTATGRSPSGTSTYWTDASRSKVDRHLLQQLAARVRRRRQVLSFTEYYMSPRKS